jgi:hypothetical protein
MDVFRVLKNDVYPGCPGITIRGGLGIYWGLTAKNPSLTVAYRIGAALCFSGVRGPAPEPGKARFVLEFNVRLLTG